MAEHLNLTLPVDRIGRSSLSLVIVGHLDGVETTCSVGELETHRAIELPSELRQKFEDYLERTMERHQTKTFQR